MQLFKIKICVFACAACYCLLTLYGCATAPYERPRITPEMPGIYHKIEKGQTLWRISKTYDVDIEELAKINRISDTSTIEVGQLIFIPNRQIQKPIPASFSNDDFIWPLRGKVITVFGQVSNNMVNKGINILPAGSSDVTASRSGRVVFCDPGFGSFGKTIIIEHGDGFSTVYARTSQVFVKPGDAVQKGALIAKTGSPEKGRGTYLHFEIRKGATAQNPYYYLP